MYRYMIYKIEVYLLYSSIGIMTYYLYIFIFQEINKLTHNPSLESSGLQKYLMGGGAYSNKNVMFDKQNLISKYSISGEDEHHGIPLTLLSIPRL